MVKIMFVLVFVIFVLQICNCSKQSPVAVEGYPPPDPSTENVIKIWIKNDPYNDTIPTGIYDTLKDSSLSEVGFKIDVRNSQFRGNGSLGKVALDRPSLRDFRVDSIDAVTLNFVSLDSKDTVNYNYPIVNGVCAVTKVKVPSGHAYQAIVSFWWVPKCPWSTYYIYDRSFSAVDTVNLKIKSKDTLNLVFDESVRIKFFVGLKVPGKGPWTEGKSYVTYPNTSFSVPVLYKNGTLFYYWIMEDLRSRSTQTTDFSSDTGKVSMSFVPDIMTMLKNNGVVMVSADSVFFGVHETHEDSLGWVPMDDAPAHVRY